MRIKENGISFRNEVNIFNPKEMFLWIFTNDYYASHRFVIDGIKMEDSGDFNKLNKFQLEKIKNFQKKYENVLPRGLNRFIKEYAK